MENNLAARRELISENNDINLSDSIDLDWAQITYALNAKHLLFITNYKIWLNFNNGSLDNLEYTAEQLCERFLKRILPNIYDYELTEEEEYHLSLLNFHPDFEKTEQGFILSNSDENLCFPPDMATIQPLLASGKLKEMGFIAEDIHSNKQIIITHHSQQTMRSKFMFNEENSTLLSFAFSSDEDLPCSAILTIEEIHKHFKHAKNNFELKGQLPTNVNIRVDDLIKKLTAICELKTTITKLLENFP